MKRNKALLRVAALVVLMSLALPMIAAAEEEAAAGAPATT